MIPQRHQRMLLSILDLEKGTVEDIMEAYIESWQLGLKAVAIYRDGSKKAVLFEGLVERFAERHPVTGERQGDLALAPCAHEGDGASDGAPSTDVGLVLATLQCPLCARSGRRKG